MSATQPFGSVDVVVGALSAPALASTTPRPTAFNRLADQFLQMQAAYARTGGLISGTDAAHRLRHHCEQPLSVLARWIVARSVVSFEWRSHILVPLFQFDPRDMAVRPEVIEVMREFADVFDAWESAHWFARPNVWLQHEAPVDAIICRPSQVLSAARTDRFVASG